jgi:hypothetical protein
MRVSHIPTVNGESRVAWDRIDRFSFATIDKEPRVVVHYLNGAKKFLLPEQAAHLWQHNETHKGCEFPCYFRQQCDTAPDTCRSCQLAEVLAGLDDDPRPTRFQVVYPFDWRNVALVLLAGLVVLLIGVADAAMRPLPHPQGLPNVGTGANARR